MSEARGNIAENAIRKVYERYKDCLPVLNAVTGAALYSQLYRCS
ncbi:MAG: hypothetical protein WAK17_19375 [Candidatus Nitrosopolaris sp.]